MNVIQKPVPNLIKGLAIGWGVPLDAWPRIKAALPGWAVVTVQGAPKDATFTDYATPRRLSGAARDKPLVLFGFGPGCDTLRTVLLSGFVKPWGCAALALPDLSQEKVRDFQVDTWARAAERTRTGLAGPLLVTTAETNRAVLDEALVAPLAAPSPDSVIVRYCPPGDPLLGLAAFDLLKVFA